ncbi:MAG: ribosome maturation factor RimM [Pyrinomonadaceae bacterium]|nr:ribosome maturation factor RimM [Acidobacteriota bacterium]MDQ3490456.1 ribosome maturation factor RimM [Acidobacteriota bacterium]
MEDLVAIARISKPRGLRGEVVADVLTDFPERFEALPDVIGLFPDSEQRELKIEKFFFQKGRVVLKFSGYDSIESAETLRNVEVCIAETDAAELSDGEFFDWQLIGCAVQTIEGEPIGSVSEVMRTGGTEILVVQGETKEYMIPFAEAICKEVDVDRKTIRVDAPEGLLDF